MGRENLCLFDGWRNILLSFLAVLFLLFYERDFMTSLSDDNQADIIEAFNPTSKYLDALLILTILISKILVIKCIHLNCSRIKLMLQISKPPFWIYIHNVSTSNGCIYPKVMIIAMSVDLPFLDVDVPRRILWRVHFPT